MRMRLGIVPVVAVILAIGSVTFASASDDSSSGRRGGEEIKVLAVTDQSADFPVTSGRPSLGDRFTFSDKLYERRGGDQVGIDGGECLAIRLDSDAHTVTVQCVVTASFDDRGQITGQGLVTFDVNSTTGGTFTVAITGGTGDFRGASGEVKVEETSQTESTLTFSID